MSITIEQAIELHKQGTAVVGNSGKVSFRKEKGYRSHPTANTSK